MPLASLLKRMPMWMATANASYDCPSSPAFLHASAKVQVQTASACADLSAEILARVHGQYEQWHDPHNNGTYSVLKQSDFEIQLQRRTGGAGKYVDKQTLVFAPAATADDEGAGGGCVLYGCSESQVTSVLDYSTNYCNLRNLYCGSADGCKVMTHDIAAKEMEVRVSSGAGKDKSACLTV